MRKGKGNRIFYRPDKILAWLAGEIGKIEEPWEICEAWLRARELEVYGPSKESIEWFCEQLDHVIPA